MLEFEKDKLHFFITEELFKVDKAPPESESNSSEVQDEVIKPETESSATDEIPNSENSKELELLVVVNSPTSEEQEVLNKIIEAVGLSQSDTSLLPEVPKELSGYNRVLIFDDRGSDQSEYYHPNDSGQSSIMKCASIRQVASDKNEKIKLWTALKTWFGI